MMMMMLVKTTPDLKLMQFDHLLLQAHCWQQQN